MSKMTRKEFCESRGLPYHSGDGNELVEGGQMDLLCTCNGDGDKENCYCAYENNFEEGE